jgi:hypothetical protein
MSGLLLKTSVADINAQLSGPAEAIDSALLLCEITFLLICSCEGIDLGLDNKD